MAKKNTNKEKTALELEARTYGVELDKRKGIDELREIVADLRENGTLVEPEVLEEVAEVVEPEVLEEVAEEVEEVEPEVLEEVAEDEKIFDAKDGYRQVIKELKSGVSVSATRDGWADGKVITAIDMGRGIKRINASHISYGSTEYVPTRLDKLAEDWKLTRK